MERNLKNRSLLGSDALSVQVVQSTPNQMVISPTKAYAYLKPARDHIFFKISLAHRLTDVIHTHQNKNMASISNMAIYQEITFEVTIL